MFPGVQMVGIQFPTVNVTAFLKPVLMCHLVGLVKIGVAVQCVSTASINLALTFSEIQFH